MLAQGLFPRLFTKFGSAMRFDNFFSDPPLKAKNPAPSLWSLAGKP